jgi:8-oxo-dGTP pyrophosphatase MutT (NUDIX family)
MSGRGVGADLRRRLSAYQPADVGEGEAVAAVMALLETDDSFSAARFDPGHITASAFVLHPHEPAVALILHSKIGRWLQPGGHVEPGDRSIVDAALREVREEVGVGSADEPWMCDVDVHTFPARHDVPMHLHHDVRVAFTADTGELMIGDGADDVRWWPLADALSMEESMARPIRKLAEWRRLRN